MKAPKLAAEQVEFKVWCERCCIRIAPNEERTFVRGKAYHVNCYSKIQPATAKAAARTT
jgi:hypothetical protein